MLLEPLNRVLFGTLDATGASPGAVAVLKGVAEAPVWLLPVLVAGMWLLGDRTTRVSAITAGLSCCVAMAVAHLASVVIDHPRPFMAGLAPNLLDHAADSSFPSDHTTLFFALAVSVARHPVPRLPGLAGWLAALGLAVGLARVALGVHFPLDIAGAVVIGAAAAVATDTVLRPFVRLLHRVGDHMRHRIGPLAARDAARDHARPAC